MMWLIGRDNTDATDKNLAPMPLINISVISVKKHQCNQRKEFTPLENLSKTVRKKISLTGFTFVELMLVTVILSIGLVFVLGGLITGIDAFNSSRNYLEALQFSEQKIFEIEASVKLNGGIRKENQKGDFSSNSRQFNWELNIDSLKVDEDSYDDLNEVDLRVNWQERNIPKDLIIATYLNNKKE